MKDDLVLSTRTRHGNTVKPELLASMTSALQELGGDQLRAYWNTLDEDNQTRLCIWNGQSNDGRKWKKALGEEPAPFEGAADSRNYLVDLILKFKIALAVEAITRANAAVMPVTSADADVAGRVFKLLTWQVRNIWRSNGRRAIKLLVNWLNSDGGAAFHSYYAPVLIPQPVTVTLEQVVEAFVDALAQEAEDPLEFEQDAEVVRRSVSMALLDPEREEEALERLSAIFPNDRPAALKRLLRDLRGEGMGTRVETILARDSIRPVALRVGVDLFFDRGVDNIQDAPYLFLVERISYAEGMQRADVEGWDPAFVKAVFGNPDKDDPGLRGQYVMFEQETDTLQEEQTEAQRYEIVTCYRKAMDDEGRIGVYRVVYCPAHADGAANEDELVDDAYGEYPLVYFTREVLSSRLLDSRGWPQIGGPAQSLIKWLRDLAINVTALKTLPPLRAPQNRRESELLLAPLSVIREKRPGEVSVFNDFQYPREALDVAKLLEENLNRLAAVPMPGQADMVAELLQQDEIKDVMAGMEEFYLMVITQMLHNMSPARLEQIVGAPMDDIRPEDLAGRVAITVSFDPRHLNQEFVKGMMEVFSNFILPGDTGATIMRDKMTKFFVRLWDPTIADEVTRDGNDAAADEAREEQDQIGRILAGFDPELFEYEDGVDFQARMDVLQQWLQANAARPMDEITTERLKQHIDNLTQMLEQRQNVGVGRTGVRAGNA
jgi:hypothetical protein